MHGYLMLPDYIAIGMLIGNVVFLISLLIYGLKSIYEEEKVAGSIIPKVSRKVLEKNLLEIHPSLTGKLLFQKDYSNRYQDYSSNYESYSNKSLYHPLNSFNLLSTISSCCLKYSLASSSNFISSSLLISAGIHTLNKGHLHHLNGDFAIFSISSFIISNSFKKI